MEKRTCTILGLVMSRADYRQTRFATCPKCGGAPTSLRPWNSNRASASAGPVVAQLTPSRAVRARSALSQRATRLPGETRSPNPVEVSGLEPPTSTLRTWQRPRAEPPSFQRACSGAGAGLSHAAPSIEIDPVDGQGAGHRRTRVGLRPPTVSPAPGAKAAMSGSAQSNRRGARGHWRLLADSGAKAPSYAPTACRASGTPLTHFAGFACAEQFWRGRAVATGTRCSRP